MKTKTLLAATIVLLAVLAGCSNPLKQPAAGHYAELGYTGGDASGTDGTQWPDLKGAKVTVLDQGAFDAAFAKAKPIFERLTNATVVRIEAEDAGSALAMVMDAKGKPPADVIYGIDNAMLGLAVDAGVLAPYKPLLAQRLHPEHVFFGTLQTPEEEWFATPVDFGYVGINYDADRVSRLAGLPALRDHAGDFVTSDPTLSSPGLAFLLTTVAAFGDQGLYDWRAYWEDLFENNVTVVDDWGAAYAGRFSAGYNSPDAGGDGRGDKWIVTSYTESPAYEAHWGRDEDDLAHVLTAPGTTYKQVQTMAILDGTPNRVAAEAWIEFTLTDAFQALAAPESAVYPVVDWHDPRVDPDLVYGDVDPEPGTFVAAQLDWRLVGDNLPRWLCEWEALRDGDREGIHLCLQD